MSQINLPGTTSVEFKDKFFSSSPSDNLYAACALYKLISLSRVAPNKRSVYKLKTKKYNFFQAVKNRNFSNLMNVETIENMAINESIHIQIFRMDQNVRLVYETKNNSESCMRIYSNNFCPSSIVANFR